MELKMLEDKLIKELEKIGQGTITSQTLDTTVKLSEAIKNLMKAETYAGDDYSNRGRSRMTGRYTRTPYDETGDSYDWDRYMESKSNYRYSRANGDKQQMLSDLSGMLDKLTTKLENVCRDTDCNEEIDMIQRYMSRLKNLK